MDAEEFSNWSSGISSLITVLAVLIGGFWTYSRFIRNREAHPKIQFDVDICFVVKQNGFWIAEAIAFLDNKGLVRHDINKFEFSIRYLLKTDPVEGKEDFLVYVPHDAGGGSWVFGWRNTFVEPGVKNKYSSLIKIPEGASAVLIHGVFYYQDKDWHTSEKLISVPD